MTEADKAACVPLRAQRLTAWLLLALAALLLAACAGMDGQRADSDRGGYFDPHTHLSGVLPWQARSNLPAYVDGLQGRGAGVSEADKRAFYRWLAHDWYGSQKDKLGDGAFASDQRVGLGARATLELFPPDDAMDVATLDGVLERLYTATPFTEFDSAYALHKPAQQWLGQRFYDDDGQALDDALCTAQVLELARTQITDSEQSISFIGGWRHDDSGYSSKLHDVLCAAQRPGELAPVLQGLGLPVPEVRIILMTHTHELGQDADGSTFQTFEHSGQCHAEPLPAALRMSPELLYNALLGRDQDGQPVVDPAQQIAFFDALAGLDTAAPEMTCFTDAGMAHYQRLIDATLRAAKARRALGWTGKLLVHTHVGENFGVYYAQQPPARPWTFDTVFAQLPVLSGNVVTNAEVPGHNIDQVLDAIEQARRDLPELDDYVIIRLGHVTYASAAQAQRMAELGVEADVNLDSNLSTGSWSLTAMPAADTLLPKVTAAAADPARNFELNDLSAFLMPDAGDATTVAGVLGTHPLKHLLMAGVRVMLSTDGAGVEHASMAREYALADSLIRHWRDSDPEFAARAASASTQTFDDNARWHLQNMKRNAPLAYASPRSQ